MHSANLSLNILLGIFVSTCIVSVLCTEEIDIQEENVYVFKKPIADENIIEILRTKRAAPKVKATTPKANKPLVKSACEKSKLQVTCPKGQVIHFLQASYGRTNLAKCNPNKNKKFNVKCKSNKSDKIMKDKCHQKNSCTVEASNSVFGDPCRSTIKYLEMKYKCVTQKKTTKTVNNKKTTPIRITPKKEATTRIPLTKGTTQQVTTPKKATTLVNTSPVNPIITMTPTTKELTEKETTVQETTHQETTEQEKTHQETTSQATTEQETTEQETTEQEITEQETTEQETTEQETAEQDTTVQETTEQETTEQKTAEQDTTVQETTAPFPTTAQTQNPITTKTRVTAPETKCDLDDLDCIVDDLGDKPKWFVCESDMGSYPHPTSRKLFIFCMNWKPSVKKCGQNLVFSEDLMTCVSP